MGLTKVSYAMINGAPFNVLDYGAKGDGVTDDTAAIQATIDAAINAGGGVVYFPATGLDYYKITSTLNIDYSSAFYLSNRFAKKIHLIGEGSASTCITPTSGDYVAISLKGSADPAVYFKMQGLRLSGTAPVSSGSTGLLTDKAAYVVLDDVIIETFNQGFRGTDTEQIGVYDTEIRYNNVGVVGNTGVQSSPNSWSFYNTLVAGNFKGGIYITNANAFNYNGGSIQYNGYIGGDSSQYGVQIVEAGNGYGTVGFTNMIFEGNGGLGDFVSGQVTYPATISFDNVSFLRTVAFSSATVTGASNNGSGAIRLTVNSTAPLVGKPKVAVWGVVGTTEANNALPWNFTIIDGTHIDLIGSTFTNAYISGGNVSVVGYGTNNILMDGSNADTTVAITNCTFKYGLYYLQSAARPTIALSNPYCKISDDGTNYFQSATEKLTYLQVQQIGDDDSYYAAFTPTVSVGSGTYTATTNCKVKKINKTVFFQMVIATSSYTATPTTLKATLPFTVGFSSVGAGINFSTGLSCVGLMAAGTSEMTITKYDGSFPVSANGEILIISGHYATAE